MAKKISELTPIPIDPTDDMLFEIAGDFGSGIESRSVTWLQVRTNALGKWAENYMGPVALNYFQGHNLNGSSTLDAGTLNMDANGTALGGSIRTEGGWSGVSGGNGGSIITRGASLFVNNGGNIWTNGSDNALGETGGNVYTYGHDGLPGGNLITLGGGGSLDTRGVGLLEFGALGTRTSLVGSATTDRDIVLPDADGTLLIGPNIELPGNILTLRNGANAQALQVYGTYTNGSNYNRIEFDASDTDNYILTRAEGTGNSTASFRIGTTGSGSLDFWQGNGAKWQIISSGDFVDAADHTDRFGDYPHSPVGMELGDEGIVLTSPDSTRYRITVANGGTLSIAAA